jgi:exonuclease SbcC
VRLDSLSIKGVLRFHEPVTLNFRELPPGLIAIVGPNGAGKTTLMDAPFGSIYRHFPSRDGELFDYATRTDAHIETTFELEGRGTYRARVNVDGPHRKAEAVLLKVGNAPGGTFMNDGKVSTFDAAVATILPPMSDLLASVFAAQNRRGGFSALDRKGKRELFASLLGLDHIEAMAERARQAVSRVSLEADRLSARREILERSVTAEIESSLEQRAQQLQVTAGSVDSRRTELHRLIAVAEQRLTEVREAIDLHARAVAAVLQLDATIRTTAAEKDSLTEALRRLEADFDQQMTRLDASLTSATKRFQADEADTSLYDTEIRQIEARRQAVIDDATKRIAANDALKKDADAIRAAVARLDGIDAALTKVEAKRSERADQLATLRKRERVLLDALGVIRERENALTYAEKNAAALDGAPFGEKCAPCAFMANAAAAKADIPSLREAVASKATAEADLRVVQDKITSAETFIGECVSDALELRRERAEKQPKASELPHLTAAEEKIAGHQKRIADAESDAIRDRAEAAARRDQRILRLRTDQANRRDEYDGAVTVLSAATNTRRDELHANAVAAHDRLEALQAERTAARATVDRSAEPAGKAAEQESILAAYRREWDETTATRATVSAQLEEHRRQVASFAETRRERDEVASRLAVVQTDLVEWQVLAKALGREGLQTLEIDAAGPTVSAFANDLLQACYGGRFTLELVTQAPKVTKGKDGSTFKEVFEANVYDQLRGGEKRDLADLSGGERVIVEEVLRSSIALLVNTRNSHPIRTAWRDETTGALDAENAERYIAMLRRVQQIGGFHQILFVTHNPDCARLADAQVQVADGAVSIALPPFVRELPTLGTLPPAPALRPGVAIDGDRGFVLVDVAS